MRAKMEPSKGTKETNEKREGETLEGWGGGKFLSTYLMVFKNKTKINNLN